MDGNIWVRVDAISVTNTLQFSKEEYSYSEDAHIRAREVARTNNVFPVGKCLEKEVICASTWGVTTGLGGRG